MTDLVTLDEAKARLRIDGNDMDADLSLAIAGASASVVAYLKREDWTDPADVPANVKNATIMLAGMFIRDPDGAESQTWQQGYLPNAVVAILYPLRDPALE
ncbi:head-tail connector protein [Paraburkholderia youngii]|uniref:head-tail connector protein n=1 Tax=Paraburkholderia youngii TaxID=2782701 RepID=UPI003D1D95FD